MRYTKLGHTGIEVSVIALGCWPFGGQRFWGSQDDSDSIATVHAALDLGINFFDTAEAYDNGKSEEVLGEALRDRRDKAVVATKVSQGHLSQDDVQTACENSLQRLQTDVIDLYQIHWPNWEIPIAETMGALEDLKQQGKIRAYGVSNFGVQDLTEAMQIGSITTNQLPYSLLWRVIEDEIRPLCVENNIGILCYSSLAQGLLTGRYATIEDVPDHIAQTRWYSKDRPSANHSDAGCEEEVFVALAQIRQIAQELDATMATIALAWLLNQSGVTSALVGARNPEELHWNLPAVDMRLGNGINQLSRITAPVKAKLEGNPDMWMSISRMR